MENFPDLDLSPIPNITPINNNCQQSKIEFNDKEVTHLKVEKFNCFFFFFVAKGNRIKKILISQDNEQSHEKDSLDDENRKNLSNSTQSVKCLEKSSDFYFSCWDFKSFLTPNVKKSKIPKLNLNAEEEELHVTKQNALGSSGIKKKIK